MATLVSDSTAKVTASTVQASEQLAGAVNRLHGSSQAMAAAAKESNAADADLATKLAAAAAHMGDDTTGVAHMQLVAAQATATPLYQTTLTKLLSGFASMRAWCSYLIAFRASPVKPASCLQPGCTAETSCAQYMIQCC